MTTVKDEQKVDTVAISPEIIKMSKKIAPVLVISEHGVLTEKEGGESIFLKVAPENVRAAYQAVQEHESMFATAALHAFGPLAIDHQKEHRDNKRVYGIIQTGETAIALNYTAPTGKKADGTPKDPSVTVAYRRKEHSDHEIVRREIYTKTKELFD